MENTHNGSPSAQNKGENQSKPDMKTPDSVLVCNDQFGTPDSIANDDFLSLEPVSNLPSGNLSPSRVPVTNNFGTELEVFSPIVEDVEGVEIMLIENISVISDEQPSTEARQVGPTRTMAIDSREIMCEQDMEILEIVSSKPNSPLMKRVKRTSSEEDVLLVSQRSSERATCIANFTLSSSDDEIDFFRKRTTFPIVKMKPRTLLPVKREPVKTIIDLNTTTHSTGSSEAENLPKNKCGPASLARAVTTFALQEPKKIALPPKRQPDTLDRLFAMDSDGEDDDLPAPVLTVLADMPKPVLASDAGYDSLDDVCVDSSFY